MDLSTTEHLDRIEQVIHALDCESKYADVDGALESLRAIRQQFEETEGRIATLEGTLCTIISRVALVSPYYEMARAALEAAPKSGSLATPTSPIGEAPANRERSLTRHAESCASLNILKASAGALIARQEACNCGVMAELRKDWESGDYECHFEDFYRHWTAPSNKSEVGITVTEYLNRIQHTLIRCSEVMESDAITDRGFDSLAAIREILRQGPDSAMAQHPPANGANLRGANTTQGEGSPVTLPASSPDTQVGPVSVAKIVGIIDAALEAAPLQPQAGSLAPVSPSGEALANRERGLTDAELMIAAHPISLREMSRPELQDAIAAYGRSVRDSAMAQPLPASDAPLRGANTEMALTPLEEVDPYFAKSGLSDSDLEQIARETALQFTAWSSDDWKHILTSLKRLRPHPPR